MLKKEDWYMIQEKTTQGMYRKDIAAELGVHPRTVRCALVRGAAPRAAGARSRPWAIQAVTRFSPSTFVPSARCSPPHGPRCALRPHRASRCSTTGRRSAPASAG